MRRRALCGDSPAGCRRRSRMCSASGSCARRCSDACMGLLPAWRSGQTPRRQLCPPESSQAQTHPGRQQDSVQRLGPHVCFQRLLSSCELLTARRIILRGRLSHVSCRLGCVSTHLLGRVASLGAAFLGGRGALTPWGSLLCHHLCPLGGRVGHGVFSGTCISRLPYKGARSVPQAQGRPERTGVHVIRRALGLCCKHHWRSDTTHTYGHPHAHHRQTGQGGGGSRTRNLRNSPLGEGPSRPARTAARWRAGGS